MLTRVAGNTGASRAIFSGTFSPSAKLVLVENPAMTSDWLLNPHPRLPAPAQLFSSTALNNPAQNTGLGYGSAAALGTSTWGAESLPAAAVVVKYTYKGDANLDGRVTGDDFTLTDRGGAMQLAGWTNGDFNYDNFIDDTDMSLLTQAYVGQGPAL